ncbi:unnamed protein product, partial [Closterium sp. NIES-53]
AGLHMDGASFPGRRDMAASGAQQAAVGGDGGRAGGGPPPPHRQHPGAGTHQHRQHVGAITAVPQSPTGAAPASAAAGRAFRAPAVCRRPEGRGAGAAAAGWVLVRAATAL